MDAYRVGYLDTEGNEDFIEVEGDDTADAEEAARGELSAAHPSVESDEWEITFCDEIPASVPKA